MQIFDVPVKDVSPYMESVTELLEVEYKMLKNQVIITKMQQSKFHSLSTFSFAYINHETERFKSSSLSLI